MTLGIRYAARSDVGMLREGNEDSAYAGAHLLAVADGMGGHVGGEIASAAAIEALRALDKDLPATELLAADRRTFREPTLICDLTTQDFIRRYGDKIGAKLRELGAPYGRLQAEPLEPWAALAHALLLGNEFVFVD